MKKLLLASALFISIQYMHAQAELTSWIMTSGFAQYTTGGPTITLPDSGDVQLVCYNTNFVYVKATGVAGTYIMGPWVGNPNVPAGKNYNFKIARNPTEELGTKTPVPMFGSVGVAVNGVVFYGYGDARSYNTGAGQNTPNGDGNWFSDAWVSEGTTMDPNGNGHPDQMSNYHYHANPSQLYSTSGANHSPIIGFAYDGFPMYGPFGYTSPMDNMSGISRMVSGYELRAITDRTVLPGGSPSIPAGPAIGGSFPLGTYIQDYEYTGNGDLDEYNGRWCVTPEYPGPVGTYAYFMTTASNGDPQFPYLFAAEYYGVVDNTSTNNTVPGGLNCGTVTELMEANKFKNGIKLYPNPVIDVISFLFDGEYPNQIIINNAVGQQVLTTTNSVSLNINQLPEGIYSATFLFDEYSQTLRFVKQ